MAETKTQSRKELDSRGYFFNDWWWFILYFVAISVAVAVAGWGYANSAKEKYSHYDAVADNYITKHDFWARFSAIRKECENRYSEEDSNICDRYNAEISGLLSSSDLAAQRSMAASTKGILGATYDLLALSIFSTILLMATVGTSIWILSEARKTTLAANSTVNVAKDAERAYMFSNHLGLTPFAISKIKSARTCISKLISEIKLRINIARCKFELILIAATFWRVSVYGF